MRSGASLKAGVGRAEKSLDVRLGLAAGSASRSPRMITTEGGGLWVQIPSEVLRKGWGVDCARGKAREEIFNSIPEKPRGNLQSQNLSPPSSLALN